MMLKLTLLISLLYVAGIKADIIEMNQHYKTLLLNLHNDYRRKVLPEAADMPALTWDDTLSNEAKGWAKRCDFKHQYAGRGENLAYNSMPMSTDEYVHNALEAWFNERNHYYLGPQPCGTACHYTQMVWHTTTKVGCAMNVCDWLRAFSKQVENAWYLVCFYDPKGNWVGERPYEPGSPCSHCLEGQTCDNGLCIGEGKEVCVDKNDNCDDWQGNGECDANPNYMHRECRKACGICKGSSCVDSHPNCREWAEDGECRKNPKWMLENCRKSCNACTD